MIRATPLALVAAVAASSCGGNGSSGASGVTAGTERCPAAAPCGGDVVGTWNITSSCLTGVTTPTDSACSGTLTVTGFTETGSVTFNADGTYQWTISAAVKSVDDVPPSCLPAPGLASTCDTVAMSLMGSGTLMLPSGATGGSATVSCAASGATCRCDSAYALENATTSAKYSLSGSTIDFGSADYAHGGIDVHYDYCVQGNSLRLFTSELASMVGVPLPGTEILATRQ